MKYSPFIAPSLVLMVIAFNQTFAGSGEEINAGQSAKSAELEHVSQLAGNCHENWREMAWVIGESGSLARDNAAFDQGIKRVCQARAELFFEGYEITPFIAPDSQAQIYPIVFRPSVEEIKAQIRINLPQLRLI